MFPATPPTRARRRMTHRLLQLALIIIEWTSFHAHRVFLGRRLPRKDRSASTLGDVRSGGNIIPRRRRTVSRHRGIRDIDLPLLGALGLLGPLVDPSEEYIGTFHVCRPLFGLNTHFRSSRSYNH
ncbi:hypothetical protein DPMN_120160 [Dreissena polymorpha]|uniref:Uncharacterized protein n=1 Tax=Dreissena polymorpha TaxID=45954 RepID=A0A9D4GKB4_DREPO|nr:hypothetical protein DPMN_120160 [Dreissena polymorpha]